LAWTQAILQVESMHIVERSITLDEFREERLEPFEAHPFGGAIRHWVLMEGQMSRIVVLDLVGALAGSESHELRVHTKRLIERGERTIVINLKLVTKADQIGLAELISCYISIIQSGGAMLLANPPRKFGRFVAGMKFC
jgi:anti-anti-sigma regulatory factor